MTQPITASSVAKLHPLQLSSVEIGELRFSTTKVTQEGRKIKEFSLGHARSSYIESDRAVDVILVFEAGNEALPEDLPFYLKIVLRGRFVAALGSPSEKIEGWADVGAPYIMMPYMREHVSSITRRLSFETLLIPLYQLPLLDFQIQASVNKTDGQAELTKVE